MVLCVITAVPAAAIAGNPDDMTMILVFVILYVVAAGWDVGHVNGLLEKMVNPGAHRQARPSVEPAPRLVLTSQAAGRPHA
jgi:hypothetical protein